MKKRIGLSANSYDQTTGEAKSTDGAAMELSRRGYDATTDKLKKLVSDGHVPPSSNEGKLAAWTRERIELAANHFEKTEDYSSDAAFLLSRNLTMTNFQDALNDAHREASDKYGRVALAILDKRPNEDHFVMHLESSFGKKPARIWFTLREEIETKIERERGKR